MKFCLPTHLCAEVSIFEHFSVKPSNLTPNRYSNVPHCILAWSSKRVLPLLTIGLISSLLACGGRRHGQDADQGNALNRTNQPGQVTLCQIDTDCAEDEFCHYTRAGADAVNESGSCQKDCSRDEECELGQSCIRAHCYTNRECDVQIGSSDCPAPEVCNPQLARCTAPPETCYVADQCPHLWSCQDNQCAPPSSDEPTQENNACADRANGQLGETCAGAADCCNGLCIGDANVGQGQCTQYCTSDTDCVNPDLSCVSIDSGSFCVSSALATTLNETSAPNCEGRANGQYGDTCTGAVDCCNGLCIGGTNALYGTCTLNCTSHQECNPNGGDAYLCLGVPGEGRFCTPSDFKQPCYSNNSCQGQLCLQGFGTSGCTLPCNSNDDCPSNSTCGSVAVDSGFGIYVEVQACAPVGEMCVHDNYSNTNSCLSGTCLLDEEGNSGYCTGYCNIYDDNPCPQDYVCAHAFAGYPPLCIHASNIDDNESETENNEAENEDTTGLVETGNNTPTTSEETESETSEETETETSEETETETSEETEPETSEETEPETSEETETETSEEEETYTPPTNFPSADTPGSYVYNRLPVGGLRELKSVAFHPDGSFALLAETYDIIRIFNSASQETQEYDLEPSQGHYYWEDITFSPSGSHAWLVGEHKYTSGGSTIRQGIILTFTSALWQEEGADDPFVLLENVPSASNVSAVELDPYQPNDPYFLFRTKTGSNYSVALRQYLFAENSFRFIGAQATSAGCQDMARTKNAFGELGWLIVCGINGYDGLYISETDGVPQWRTDLANNNLGNTSHVAAHPSADYALAISWTGRDIHRFIYPNMTSSSAAIGYSNRKLWNVAFKDDGSRALVFGGVMSVYGDTFAPVIEYRHDHYDCPSPLLDGCELTEIPINNITQSPFAATSNTNLNDAAWRPGCDGGFIVGGYDNFGMLLTFEREGGVSCW